MDDGVNTNRLGALENQPVCPDEAIGVYGPPRTHFGQVNSAGGSITEDEFWRATEAILNDLGHRRGFMVFSPRTLELGRDAALAAAGVANWCWAREAEMPRWAWRRRAWWRAAGIRAATDAEGFWGTFGTGDVL